jgi:hypothetical protein
MKKGEVVNVKVAGSAPYAIKDIIKKTYSPKYDTLGYQILSELNIDDLQTKGGPWGLNGRIKLLLSEITTFEGEKVVKAVHSINSGTSSMPGIGGFAFNAKPVGMPKDAVMFSWEVFYPTDFDFALGGKYGGIFMGVGSASGGNHADTASSDRIMWQVDGGLISYVYPPAGIPQELPGLTAVGYGKDLFKAELAGSIIKGAWNKMYIGVKMNTFDALGNPNPDGCSCVIMNGKRFEQCGIRWAKAPEYGIASFDFTTFFGGPLPSPKDQFCYYKNWTMTSYQ